MAREHLYGELPDSPGVYLMKNAAGEIMYVGKAANLRRRVSSYFTRPHDARIERMVASIAAVDYRSTDTAIEALILEAQLIKELAPPFNVREKDDKSFLCVEIVKEPFPRVLLARGKDTVRGERFGPFTSATSIRQALRIIRRIFPFNTHPPEKTGTFLRPCFDYEIGLCPGTCVGAVDRKSYAKTIRNLELFLRGKKAKVIALLQKEMKEAARTLDFEEAEKLRRQIFSLQHIQDVALIRDNELPVPERGKESFRIEGYDISNISGASAVGSMVVFVNGRPDKSQYRKFRIRSVQGSDDVGMLKEVLERRFRHAGKEDWPLPNLVLVDGGISQVNAARNVMKETGFNIPIVGMAKGPARKRTDVIGRVSPGIDLKTLIAVRDEAHRFAISYHKKLRGKKFFE